MVKSFPRVKYYIRGGANDSTDLRRAVTSSSFNSRARVHGVEKLRSSRRREKIRKGGSSEKRSQNRTVHTSKIYAYAFIIITWRRRNDSTRTSSYPIPTVKNVQKNNNKIIKKKKKRRERRRTVVNGEKILRLQKAVVLCKKRNHLEKNYGRL